MLINSWRISYICTMYFDHNLPDSSTSSSQTNLHTHHDFFNILFYQPCETLIQCIFNIFILHSSSNFLSLLFISHPLQTLCLLCFYLTIHKDELAIQLWGHAQEHSPRPQLSRETILPNPKAINCP